jgi:rubrerythrin
MATMIGMKEEDLVELLSHLITLDLDAVEAYRAAIERLEHAGDREQLRLFLENHRRHAAELGPLVEAMGDTPPASADARQVLMRGRVVLAGMRDDRQILEAMKRNEDDTHRAYERALSFPTLTEPVRVALERNLADEGRHRAWLEQRLGRATEAGITVTK